MSYKNNSKVYHEADIRNDYRKLTKLLIEKNLTITTMESATSGQIASLITDTEGSSAVLKGAFVTYCNEAKIMQGVPAEVLDTYTVYSKETAEVVDYFSEEYIAAAVYKKIPIEALRKLPEPMNLIKVAPSKIEFLSSEFKKYGCASRQRVDVFRER